MKTAILFCVLVFISAVISSYREEIERYNRKNVVFPKTIKTVVTVKDKNEPKKNTEMFDKAKDILVSCGFSAKDAKNMLNNSSGDTVEAWVKNVNTKQLI
jgi:ABC-type bacteriocin/lantibiotic exporter with double-glycine peptidase domain